jgi:hypothetical protein
MLLSSSVPDLLHACMRCVPAGRGFVANSFFSGLTPFRLRLCLTCCTILFVCLTWLQGVALWPTDHITVWGSDAAHLYSSVLVSA